MNKNISLHTFKQKTDLQEKLCKKITSIINETLKQEEYAVMALSGGSTPKPLFERLSKVDLDWSKVILTLVDERWVENTNKDSNEKLIKDYLMQNQASKASFIPLKLEYDTPFEAISECSKQFKDIKQSFDIVILGMGEDAHTASFFPKDRNLKNALSTKEICAPTIPSDAPHQRMTLSLDKLLKAKNIFLHIEGEKKYNVYNNALKDGSIEDMPIRSFLRNEKNLEVYYAK